MSIYDPVANMNKIKKGDCGHFCEACARRDDEIEHLQAELTKAQELAKSRTIGHLYEQELEKNKRLEAELTRLREQEPVASKSVERALTMAWGALIEVSPCASEECQQVQSETIEIALKLVKEAMDSLDTHSAPIPEGMEQDAKRYQFLRQRRAEEGHFWVAKGFTQWSGEELDNAIDEAMLSAVKGE